MRRSRLALLLAICLLPGMALPPTATLQSVFECKAGYQASLDLTAVIPAIREDDVSRPPDRTINRYLPIPEGFTPFGLTPDTIGTIVGVHEGRPEIGILFLTATPYEAVKTRVLEANRVTRCSEQYDEAVDGCIVFAHLQQREPVFLMIGTEDGLTTVSCHYMRSQD